VATEVGTACALHRGPGRRTGHIRRLVGKDREGAHPAAGFDIDHRVAAGVRHDVIAPVVQQTHGVAVHVVDRVRLRLEGREVGNGTESAVVPGGLDQGAQLLAGRGQRGTRIRCTAEADEHRDVAARAVDITRAGRVAAVALVGNRRQPGDDPGLLAAGADLGDRAALTLAALTLAALTLAALSPSRTVGSITPTGKAGRIPASAMLAVNLSINSAVGNLAGV